jgi:hypothetical protein
MREYTANTAGLVLPQAVNAGDVGARHAKAISPEWRARGSQRMCMRSKAWLAARVSLRLARLQPLQAECGARVAYAPRLRLRQAFSRMLWSQNSKS